MSILKVDFLSLETWSIEININVFEGSDCAAYNSRILEEGVLGRFPFFKNWEFVDKLKWWEFEGSGHAS